MSVSPDWIKTGRDLGWQRPTAPRWKRLPVIRHIRAIRAAIAVDRHERFYRSIGLIPTGYDQWVIHGIWHGYEEGRE
jgi:hypothetical protein